MGYIGKIIQKKLLVGSAIIRIEIGGLSIRAPNIRGWTIGGWCTTGKILGTDTEMLIGVGSVFKKIIRIPVKSILSFENQGKVVGNDYYRINFTDSTGYKNYVEIMPQVGIFLRPSATYNVLKNYMDNILKQNKEGSSIERSNKQVKFCSKCGVKLGVGVNFCTSCGQKV